MQLPPAPSCMPRMGNRFTRAIGQYLLRMLGWEIRGQIPDRPHLMAIAAPHTSNWDFIIACCGLLALGVRLTIMMKKEAFIWPLKGLFIKLGFIPIDREQAGNVVPQMVQWYAEHERCWIVVTPEGTRSKVKHWKTGFLRIAHAAQVDVLLIALDFKSKNLVLVPELFTPTGDHDADVAQLQAFYAANFVGKHPHLQ